MAKDTGRRPYSNDSRGRNDLLPNLFIEQVPTKGLKTARHQVRKPSNRQVAKVNASIAKNGFVVPVLIGKDNEIVDGHIRVLAARKLGIQVVPCIRVGHLDEKTLRALRIALNRTQETGEWDQQALKLELTYQLEFGTDLTVLGFEPYEIDALLEITAAPSDALNPVDEIGAWPGPDTPSVTQPGDIWMLGDHAICCGNSRDLEVARQILADDVADLVFSDPPYNVPINGHARQSTGHFEEFAEASGEMSREEFTQFLTTYLAVAKKSTRPGALVYSFMDWRHLREMLAAIDTIGLELINVCLWVKPNGGMGSFYRSRHEMVFVLRHPGAPHLNNVALGAHGRYRTNVWEYAGATGGRTDEVDDFTHHPTGKPVQLVEDAILDATIAGATIFDPFLGSGTTLLAAERTRRRCIGIEISPAYVDVAIRRWEALTGGEAIHEASGMTFAKRSDDVPAAEDVSSSQDGTSTPEEEDV